MEGWIAVTRTTTLGQQPRRVSLKNKNYVVWRDENFTPRIQSDVCKHRGASIAERLEGVKADLEAHEAARKAKRSAAAKRGAATRAANKARAV